MIDKTPRVNQKTWRDDAKSILEQMRQFQDDITQTYGYEGFSPVLFSVNGLVEGKLISLVYTAYDDCVVVKLMDGDTILDTINLKHAGA